MDLNRGRHSSSDLDSADSFMIVKRQLSKSYRENYLSSDDDIKGANRSPSISSSSPVSTDQEERARPVNMSSIESGLEKIGFLESSTDKVVQTSRESLPLQNPFSLKRKLPATGTDGTALQEGREVSQVDLDCDNPEAKKKKISLHNYQLRTSHKEFVKNFVRKFEDTLKGCYDQIGKVKKVKLPTLLSEKSSKMGLIGGSVATGVAAGAGLLTVSVPAVIAIAAAAVTAGNCVDYAATKTARFFVPGKLRKKLRKLPMLDIILQLIMLK